MMADDSYQILMSNLKYPESQRLRAILENLMTPTQAQIVAALPGTAEDVAKVTGLEVPLIKKDLDDLFFAGVVFPKGDYQDRHFFRFAKSIGQLHDATQASKGRDVVKDQGFYRLWHDFVMNEWYPNMGKAFSQAPRPRIRIIPAYQAIKDHPDILPCEDMREIFKTQKRIAVVPCSCRYRTTAVDEHCAHTAEEDLWQCVQVNRGAEYALAREAGKELNLDEAFELLDKIEEHGLLHTWHNNTSMTGANVSCHCCRDCCMMAVPMDIVKEPLSKLWEKSRFIAVVKEEACIGCQTCVDRCQFDAIEMVKPEGTTKSKKLKAKINPEACFGCGVCVVGCDQVQALSMKLVRPPDHIPAAAE
jgi:NAD-dependent dihydropyrimidine dehydrogenase PreA subunit